MRHYPFLALLSLLGATLFARSPARAAEDNCALRMRGELEDSALARGQDGVYFELGKDLIDIYDLNEETADGIASVAALLDTLGTKLIAVPVPPRGLGLRESLNREDPHQRAFSTTEAIASYGRVVARLRTAGLAVVDLREALDQLPGTSRMFFKRDVPWTPEGARLAADQVARLIMADPLSSALPKAVHRTRQLGVFEHQAAMSVHLQRSCQQGFEPEQVPRYRTTREGVPLDQSGDSTRRRPAVIIAGSYHSSFATANFDGFLRELTGLDVHNRSTVDRSSYGALISLVTTPEWHNILPRYLVWEFPLDAHPNLLSSLAMRQILPAIRRTCSAETVVWHGQGRAGSDSERFAVSSANLPVGSDNALLIGIDDRTTRSLTVRVLYASGDSESLRLGTAGGAAGPGQFITTLSPEILGPITEIEVSGLSASGSMLDVRLCSSLRKQGA
jgi:hypothetical protein